MGYGGNVWITFSYYCKINTMKILKTIRSWLIAAHCVCVIVILFFIMLPQALYLWSFEKFGETVDNMVNEMLIPIKFD